MNGIAVNTYLVGMLDFEDEAADFESVAHAVNYLRGQNVKIMIGSARVADGHTRFPIVVEEENGLLSGIMGGAGNKTSEILTTVFDSCNVVVHKAAPSMSNLEQLKALSQVAFMNPRAEKVHVRDLMPRSRENTEADAFEGLVGLEAQKGRLVEIGNALAAYGRQSLESLHLCFTGEPGVGKTEMARRVHRFLASKGVLHGGPFVQASAEDLIAPYVGQTPVLVQRAFERAEGGVLFIDEAYRLSEGAGNEFGIEAINALVQLLDERRESVICIFAGYPGHMRRMLATNPGFRDRIGFHVEFPSYTTDELTAIFNRFADSKGFAVSPEALRAVHDACARMRHAEGFANARSIRRLHDRAVVKLAAREGGRTLEVEDIRRALADADMGLRAKRGVGFTA